MTVEASLFPMMTDTIVVEKFLGQDRADIKQYDTANPQLFLGKLTFEEKEFPSKGDDKRISTARFTMREFSRIDSRSRVTFPNEEIDSPRIMSVALHKGTMGEEHHTVLFF